VLDEVFNRPGARLVTFSLRYDTIGVDLIGTVKNTLE
jgi:hypothetical protein